MPKKILLPYFLPIFITLIFIAAASMHFYWVGPLLIPLIGFLGKGLGKFDQRSLSLHYSFFHHSATFKWFKLFNGIFFVLFNAWIAWHLISAPITLLNFIFLAYTAIILNSNFSISLAHDLMHANGLAWRALGTLLLLLNGFFYLETDHMHIHHRFVGTDDDPASAKLGEPLYTYLYRSVSRRSRIIFGLYTAFPGRDQIVAGHSVIRLLGCILLLGAAWQFGPQVFCWLLLQFIFVTLIYETITYIQHYGLSRAETDGKTESVQVHHSWNCYYKLSSYLNFMMPVHSIHHLKTEPEQLDSIRPGPEFPKSFMHMVIAALYPPYWFRLMNDRVLTTQSKTLKK